MENVCLFNCILNPTFFAHIYLHIYQHLQQNGWNVLHHSCASHTHNLEILRWLLEEFSHCDQLKNEDFLNQVKQVQG